MYLDQLFEIFGTHDVTQSTVGVWVIDFQDFGPLWQHLGGGDVQEEDSAEARGMQNGATGDDAAAGAMLGDLIPQSGGVDTPHPGGDVAMMVAHSPPPHRSVEAWGNRAANNGEIKPDASPFEAEAELCDSIVAAASSVVPAPISSMADIPAADTAAAAAADDDTAPATYTFAAAGHANTAAPAADDDTAPAVTVGPADTGSAPAADTGDVAMVDNEDILQW
eukprot:SAG11_NODE_61_length_19011_cov_49.624048_11_plen_222_part_00